MDKELQAELLDEIQAFGAFSGDQKALEVGVLIVKTL